MKVKCQVNQSNVQTFQTFLFFICPLDGVNSNIFCYLFGKPKCIMLWTDSFLKGRDIRRRKNNCNAIVVDDRRIWKYSNEMSKDCSQFNSPEANIGCGLSLNGTGDTWDHTFCVCGFSKHSCYCVSAQKTQPSKLLLSKCPQFFKM